MTVLYLGAFISGLLVGVGVMLFGIEKRARVAKDVETAALRVSVPLAAAFAVGFGALGYLASRVTAPVMAFLIALAAGGLAALLMRWIVAKSAAMVPEHDTDDERYVLQGLIADVVAPIAPGVAGQISFEFGGARRSLPAVSLDDVAVAAGTEVVIERIEGDLAYVEPWVHVERRL
jgi:membrane protein implicated in regulation of membrane protease activity